MLGTAATIRSGAFEQRILSRDPSLQVVQAACPLFVPLAENGWTDREDPIPRLTAARYLAPLKEAGVDTLILGCTHFPLLTDILSDYMGQEVTLIDSGREAAAECAGCWAGRTLLHRRRKRGAAAFSLPTVQTTSPMWPNVFWAAPSATSFQTIELDSLTGGR